MSDELRQVANGFKTRVKLYTSYDVNRYRFHMSRHEQTRLGQKTTNSQVFTLGTNGVEYYGIIEEIYELEYEGEYLLLLSYSSATGLILDERGEALILD
jgi:hypothetical protein